MTTNFNTSNTYTAKYQRTGETFEVKAIKATLKSITFANVANGETFKCNHILTHATDYDMTAIDHKHHIVVETKSAH